MSKPDRLQNKLVNRFAIAEAVDEELFDEYSDHTRQEVAEEIIMGFEKAVRDGVVWADDIEERYQEKEGHE